MRLVGRFCRSGHRDVVCYHSTTHKTGHGFPVPSLDVSVVTNHVEASTKPKKERPPNTGPFLVTNK